MRNNGIFVILALAFVITISAIGDEESSPRLFDLAVEPIAAPAQPTIATAARHNDFGSFDKLYRAADAREASAWSELHRFWSWSMTDPVGGFYGQETHDRFARAYPDYATFIEDYRIVDSNGNAFYPSAETRMFLLRHIGEQPVRTAAVPAAVSPASSRQDAGVTAGRMPALRVATPVVVSPTPIPQPEPPKVVAFVPPPVLEAPPLPVPRHDVGRGIFLIIVGLIGIGVLTVMLHAPGDEPHSTHP